MQNRRKSMMWVTALVLAGAALPAMALQVSLGIRETAANGGADVGIGGNGGASGGIEFVNRDGQSIPMDNQWHQYSWDIDGDTLMAFAGTTANSILDGDYGTIEMLRFTNDPGTADPITIWIDYVVNTVDAGPAVMADFEGFADGTEVMFQEPNFSGSTSSNLVAGGTSAVDSSTAFSGSASYKVSWTFVDDATTRWVRLTTFNATNSGNPLIRFDDNSVVSMYIKALPEPATAMMLLAGGLLVARRRR